MIGQHITTYEQRPKKPFWVNAYMPLKPFLVVYGGLHSTRQDAIRAPSLSKPAYRIKVIPK